MSETIKARQRRTRECFFEKYTQGSGIDIGAWTDPITEDVRIWDVAFGDSDAEYMAGIPDNEFDFVYSSHCIEHVVHAETAIKNWFRILRPNGYLILFGPLRDLYERKRHLPSKWNDDHKTFWHLDRDEPPCTYGILPTIARALGDSYELIYAKKCDEGWVPLPADTHAVGEYSFEVVIRKNAKAE